MTVIPLPPDTVPALLYARDDGGASWLSRDGGLSAERGGYGYAFSLAFDRLDADRLYLGLPAAVVRSLNGGASWLTVYGDPAAPGMEVSCLVTSPRRTGRVWAGGQDLTSLAFVLRSDDRGETWSLIRPSDQTDDVVFSMAPDSLNDDRLFAGMGGGIRLTDDGGTTWRSVLALSGLGLVTGPAAGGPLVIAISDEHSAIIADTGTTLGVCVSRDGGITWETVPAPPEARGGIALAPSSDRTAFIGTRSGLWARPIP